MTRLPDEIWTDILDYLEPCDIISTQRVSTRLLKVARDSRLWRYKCYEKAPSAAKSLSNRPNALSALTGALSGLSLDGPPIPSPGQSQSSGQRPWQSRRSKAVAEWDCTDDSEHIDWYSEYIGRHAPLSVEWAACKPNDAEVQGITLFNDGNSVIGPLTDGSLRIWSVERPSNQRPSLRERVTSKPGILFQDLSSRKEPTLEKELSLGHAVDNIVVNEYQKRAYVATGPFINEIDLETMSLISQNQFASPITALACKSQDEGFGLTIGTSWSLHLHDPRRPLETQPASGDDTTVKVDGSQIDTATALLPTHTNKSHNTDGTCSTEEVEEATYQEYIARSAIRGYARVRPGPQSIVHRGPNEIIIAGRMPSILFYDRRVFPQLKSSIHSGARLSSMAVLPFAPANAPSNIDHEHTLIVCGEYNGRGSLEIYGIPADTAHKHDASPPLSSQQSSPPGHGGFHYRNRQSASSSKLLSVCVQGARILVSDADGQLQWFERDGIGLTRKWNINAASYNFSLLQPSRLGAGMSPSINAGMTSHADAVRKMIPIPNTAITTTPSPDDHQSRDIPRSDDDILVWTGDKIGIVTCRTKWDTSFSHEDLVHAFETQMNLNGTRAPNQAGTNTSDFANEPCSEELEYARQMRRALERQADERRWMSVFGGRWR